MFIVFLSSFSINLLAFYHEMTVESLFFRGICEEDLDRVLND